MDFTEIIKREHQRAAEMLERLEDSSETALKTRERVSRQLAQLITEHAQKEEAQLYPALQRHREAHEGIDEFLTGARAAHATMARLATELDTMAKDDAEFTGKAGELRKLAQQHMREEERLLAALRKALGEEESEALDAGMAGRSEEPAMRVVESAASRGSEAMSETAERSNRAVLAAAGLYGETAQITAQEMQTIATCSSIAAGGLGEMRQAWMDWVNRGLRAGARASQELMRCTTIEQLAGIQRDFLKESLENLLEGSAQMLRISSRISEDAARPMEDRMLQRRGGERAPPRLRRAG